MRTISTGQPSTVGTFYGISKFFGKEAEAFMKDYMDRFGPDEEIITEEGQMLHLLATIKDVPEDQVKRIKQQVFGDNDELFEI